MTPRTRSIICGALFASQTLTACNSWQVVQVSPRALVDSAHVRSMRVTEKNGLTTILEAPRMSGDSLTGSLALSAVALVPRSIPLAAVANVAVRKLNVGNYLLISVGVVALAGAAVGLSGGFDVGWH